MQIAFRKPDMERDLYPLYLMMTGEDQYLFSTQLICNSERDFSGWLTERLRRDFQDFYCIIDSNTPDKLIGFAYDYDFSHKDGHCKICVYVTKEVRMLGLGGKAAIGFMDMLFHSYPLRKIYSTVYDYNFQSLQSNLRFGFTEEGVVAKYRYYNGHYHSLHYLSISRRQFQEATAKLMWR